MKIRTYTPEQLAAGRNAARQLAEEFLVADGDEIMDTAIGVAFITESQGIKMAVIIAPQDENGPLFQ